MENKYVVEGFEFINDHQVNEAKSEVRGINYIVSRADMNNPKSVLVVYNRIIEKKLFKTPIGIKFLKEIQEMLLASNEIDDSLIKPIPVSLDLSYSTSIKVNVDPKEKEKKKLNYRTKMINSIVINVILIIVIILMFIITNNSKNVNIINYENRIKDQYSSWEEELNQRESIITERESELNTPN